MKDRLPDESERALYRQVIEQGGRVMFREAMQQNAAATLRLIELGLLIHHDVDESLSAVNPRSVADRLSADLRDAAIRKLARSQRASAQLEDLVHAYDQAPRRPDRAHAVERVHDRLQIRHRITQLESEMHEETLAAQPGGARPVGQMQQALKRSLAFLARGIGIRTLYQPGALADPPTVDYAATLASGGERIRVLDEPFRRMLIFDRRIAIITASPDNNQAAFVEDPAVLATLIDLFERDWARATRIDWHALAGRPRGTGVPKEVGALLAQGLTQRAIASRLGLSERTVAAHIARLRELYDAETLFQLGWQLRGAPE
ncbi:LuxR C-terminal-related transcriptional regulator [Kitasatospora sp. CB02891]|uniref:LuxR C-terminal-related transcriptional regulator n=1 Tax=Kitasatospora sp. CB02891 TaxID=2020329 RepID=UPI001E464068|nr:LuxR C-terminal-related transcriptional regulator [Kitasatospora sp. CB02891]